MTAAEAVASPARSLLFEAVRGEGIELVDAPDTPHPLELGDVVVLASDGVESCSPKELAEIVSSEDAAEELVDRILCAVEAHEHTFQDNATPIAVLKQIHQPLEFVPIGYTNAEIDISSCTPSLNTKAAIQNHVAGHCTDHEKLDIAVSGEFCEVGQIGRGY